MLNALKRVWPWLLLSTLIVAADQWSKYFIAQHLSFNQPMRVLPFLNLNLRFNTGAAFSFLGGQGGWQIFLLAGMSIVAAILVCIWLFRIAGTDRWLALALSLILGGALGNLIDRVRLRYVIDFIDVHWHAWHFATFNVADSAVTVGAVILVCVLLFSRSES